MALTRITTGSISSNTITAEKVQNASIQARHFQTGTITLDLMDANANTAATEIRVNANLDLTSDNITAVIANVSTVQDNVLAVQSNVAEVQSTLIDNVNIVNSNLNYYASYGNTTFDTKANVSTTYFAALANDYATYTLLNANLDIVQDNVASIIDGTTQFTGPVTMQDALTVQGNLIVVGAQVDLGVSSAQVTDATLLLAANTPADEGLPADSGILINRGANDNVFFGFASYGDHIDFIFTEAPADNVQHFPTAYIDVHANSLGAEGIHDATFTAFHHADHPTTGIYMPAGAGTIEFAGLGSLVANITATGNMFFTTGGIIHGPSAANTLDLDDDELGDRQNSITLRSLQSVGIFLDSNDSETGNFLNIYDGTDDPNSVGKDDGIFSVRDTGEVFITDDISVEGNANILLDAVVSNAVIGTRVFEGTVGLQANDSATYFAAYANDFVTYTRLNANVNSVQSNLSTAHTDLSSNIDAVQNNVTALSGGGTFLSPFTNVNTATGTSNVFFVGRDIAAEANVLLVMLDGISQPNTEYEVNASNDTVQFTDATIPSGTIVQIFSMS